MIKNDFEEIIYHKPWYTKIKNGLDRYISGNFLNVIPVILLGIILFATFFGDSLVPYDPIELSLGDRLLAPSRDHLFGTDEYGRDIFSRVVSGTKISIRISLMVVFLSASVGVFIGTIAGLYAGIIDESLMRITDLFLAFPALMLAIIIAATLGPGLNSSMIALAFVYWPWYARLARAEVLTLRERDFVLAARVVGANSIRIILRHILPNFIPILITVATLDIGSIILTTAGLSFLGLGAQPPMPEWGAILLDARSFLRQAWWYSTFPGLALTITVLSINLLGDALRDFLDPRLRIR